MEGESGRAAETAGENERGSKHHEHLRAEQHTKKAYSLEGGYILKEDRTNSVGRGKPIENNVYSRQHMYIGSNRANDDNDDQRSE